MHYEAALPTSGWQYRQLPTGIPSQGLNGHPRARAHKLCRSENLHAKDLLFSDRFEACDAERSQIGMRGFPVVYVVDEHLRSRFTDCSRMLEAVAGAGRHEHDTLLRRMPV